MNKKILVFGFKPYGSFKTNISEIIVNKINNKKINKKIFPVVFDKGKIMKEIRKTNPEIIIGIGQHPRARKIRIERKAKNIIKLRNKKKSRLINGNSKKGLFTNLKINKSDKTILSYNAGTHECNFTMFNIMDYIVKNKKDAKFAFLHIPKDYDIRKGVNTINKIINQITNNINEI